MSSRAQLGQRAPGQAREPGSVSAATAPAKRTLSAAAPERIAAAEEPLDSVQEGEGRREAETPDE